MTNGLILLGFLAALFALAVAKLRRKAGLPVSGRVLAVTVSGFAIVVLALWATSQH